MNSGLVHTDPGCLSIIKTGFVYLCLKIQFKTLNAIHLFNILLSLCVLYFTL